MRGRSVQVERDTDNELLAAMQEEAQSYSWKVLPGMMSPTKAEELEFYSIPVKHLDGLIRAYVDYIMLSPTDETCACEWIIHPDDIEEPAGKRRVKRGAEDPNCQVHTKRGYLLGFFKQLFPEAP